MFFETRGQTFFGATATFWAFFAFTIFLGSVWAAPQHLFENELSQRAESAAGIGVELEVRRVIIVSDALTSEQRAVIRGAEIKPVDFAGSPMTNWKLTAEYGVEGFKPEVIVDGLKNKVGEHKTKGIGEEIFKFFVCFPIPLATSLVAFLVNSFLLQGDWAPCRAKGCKVTIDGFDNLGPWWVKWPEFDPVDPATLTFDPQVTTAMPLGAVLNILSDTKSKTLNPLTNMLVDGSQIRILTRKDFSSFSKINKKDITDDFLGFFSLLTSYCVLAGISHPDDGPKRSLLIMPRTDFATQYTAFIEPKLKKQLSKKKASLYNIVQQVSGAGSNLDKLAFKWTPREIAQIDDNWMGKAEDIQTGTLAVEKFLNYLQGYDPATKKALPQMDLVTLMEKAMRYGQIGGLGSKMETMTDTSQPIPIFEFRELERIKGPDLAATMGSYEDKVIEYYTQFAKRSIDVSEDAETEEDDGDSPKVSQHPQHNNASLDLHALYLYNHQVNSSGT